MMKKFAPLAALIGLSLASAAVAAPVVIGPAVNNTFTGIDGTGQRINIDQNNPLILAPGTYTASQFSFFATTTGKSTTPFLAVNSDAATPNPGVDVDAYKIVASGASFTAAPVAGTNVVQNVPFGGGAGATFTLTATTKVFAGVASGSVDDSSSNAIGYISGTSVDHHNPTPTQFTPAAGVTIPTFSNADLGRVYGFNITVDAAVPEPASLGLIGLAGLALLRRRGKR